MRGDLRAIRILSIKISHVEHQLKNGRQTFSANHMFEFASSDQSIERIQNSTIFPSKRHVYRGKGRVGATTAYYISLLF